MTRAETVGADDSAAWMPGEIVVKLRDSVPEPADVLVERRVPFARATTDGDDTLDRLNRANGLRAVRPLIGRPPGAPLEALGSGALARRRADAASRRDAARRRNVTRGASRVPNLGVVPDLVHVYVFEVSQGTSMADVAARYQASPHVAYAHPNYLYTEFATPLPDVAVVPDDPFLEDPVAPGFWREGSWGLAIPDLWGLQRIHALEAWNLLPDPLGDPGQGVVVAVVDGGIDYDHPDIAHNVWTNRGEIPGNGADDDGNGFVDDVRGWDFTRVHGACGGERPGTPKPPDNDPFDENGHGTHVSGTIAARADNGRGVPGVAPRATILPVRGLTDAGCGALSWLAAAIVYAADNGADVMNFSWGAVGIDPPALNDALAYAHAQGAVMVAAAGNDAQSTLERNPHTPGNSTFVMTVSALDPSDRLTFFSNFGPRIDLGAPGGGLTTPPPAFNPHWNILSLRASAATFDPQATVAGEYARLAGTSMAAPHVAGVAALVRARRPTFSNEDVRQALQHSADDVGPAGFDLDAGYGRVNAERALAIDSVPRVFIASPGSRQHVQRRVGVPISIMGTAAGPGFARYEVLLAAGNPPGAFTPLAPPVTTPVADGTLASWDATDTSAYPAGWYTLVLRVTDDRARVFESRRPIILLHPSAPDALPGWPIANADPLFGVNAIAVGDIGPPAGKEVITGSLTHIQAFSAEGQLLYSVELPIPPRASFPFLVPSLGDLDRDGDLEVVVGSPSGLHVIDRDGIDRIIAAEGVAGIPVVVDDLDGNGIPWLVAIDQQVRIAVRDPAGLPYSSSWPLVIPPPPDMAHPTAEAIATGDLDGDGRKEIVAALHGAVHALTLGGTVRWSYPPTPDPDRRIADVALGDLNGDGWLEVAVLAAEYPTLSPETSAVLTVLDREGGVLAATTMPREAARFVEKPALTLSDLDRDGDLELVAAPYSTQGRWVRLYAWHHTGATVAGFPYESATEVPEPIENPMAGDVSGDGRPDLVSSLDSRRSSRITNEIFAWNGEGALLSGWPRQLARVDPFPFGIYVGTSVPGTVLADVDDNGSLDLVAPIPPGEIHAIDLGVPVAPDALDWPMARHDVGRTGRLAPSLAPGIGIETTKLRLAPGKATFRSAPRERPGGVVPPALGSAADPTRGGAFLRVRNSAPGGAQDDVGVALPAAQWAAHVRGNGSVSYRYRRSSGLEPVSQVRVDRGRLTIKAGGPSWSYTLDEPRQERVAVTLRLGSSPAWCADAPARVDPKTSSPARYDRVDKFEAQPRTPPPVTCPP